MVVVLDGFLDAGSAAARAAQHLVDLDDGPGAGRVVATFEVDELHDYRARRPAVSFVVDRYQDYDAPRLVVRLLHDTGIRRAVDHLAGDIEGPFVIVTNFGDDDDLRVAVECADSHRSSGEKSFDPNPHDIAEASVRLLVSFREAKRKARPTLLVYRR